mgnify:FL=1
MDPTNSLLKDGLVLRIQHIPSGDSVVFKALVKSFSDSFQSDWSSESVYGRMDPIETFQGTRRTISLEWDVVSYDFNEAKENLEKTDKLTTFLYPSYGLEGDASSIKSSPLLRMKFVNLISQPYSRGDTGVVAGGSAEVPGVLVEGLVGRMDGFSYTPDFESGVFRGDGDGKSLPSGNGSKVYPQTISLSCTYYVLHTHKLGWRRTTKGLKTVQPGFPHSGGEMSGEPLKEIKAPTPPAPTATRQQKQSAVAKLNLGSSAAGLFPTVPGRAPALDSDAPIPETKGD